MQYKIEYNSEFLDQFNFLFRFEQFIFSEFTNMNNRVRFENRSEALDRRILSFAVVNQEHSDIRLFLDDAKEHVSKSLKEILAVHENVKINTIFKATFEKAHKNTQEAPDNNNSASGGSVGDGVVGEGFFYDGDDYIFNESDLEQTKELEEYIDREIEENPDVYSRLLDRLVEGGEIIEEEEPLNTAERQQQQPNQQQLLYIHSKNTPFTITSNFHEYYDESVKEYTLKQVCDYMFEGSGLTLVSINELEVNVGKYNPLRGSTYIKCPQFIAKKRAVINIQNNDNECFKWAVLSALYNPSGKSYATSSYPYDNHPEVNFTNLRFPVAIRDINNFEAQNPGISVNVYGVKKTKIYLLRPTAEVKEKHLHLLYLQEEVEEEENEREDEEDEGYGENLRDRVNSFKANGHYCWIKDFSRLIRSQITKHTSKLHFCDVCLNGFLDKEKLEKTHKPYCMKKNECIITMPNEKSNENSISFKSHHKKLKTPFIIYADIETLLKNPTKRFTKNENSKTEAYQEHEPYSIGYYFKSAYETVKPSYYRSERGANCIKWFILELKRIAEEVACILDDIKPMRMTAEENLQFLQSTRCHICNKKFSEEDSKVRDHSHITGEYRGSAHSKCNLRYQESRMVPVVFHNLSRYDAHFLMEMLANDDIIPGHLKVIASNSECYISFVKNVDDPAREFKTRIRFKFIDSFRFMSSSLDYLSSLLPSQEKYILHEEWKDKITQDQVKMLQRKGILCYDYIDCWERLNETQLPSKECFYSKLSDEGITDTEYAHALKTWDTFGITTLGEYSDLYLKTDVLLLADVFERFRDTCIDVYKLDAAHYYTSPALSFDAMLLYTSVKIELLTDVDQLMFVERGKE